MNKKGHKIMRLADDDKLDEVLYLLWFVQKGSQDMPVSRPILNEKSMQLHSKLQEGEPMAEFQASRG